jgi:renalase
VSGLLPGPRSGELPIIVVGGGISGVACARRLHDAGHRVQLFERGKRLGGRMAVRTEYLGPVGPSSVGHPVDIGAPFFTVRDPEFAAVVADWHRNGLVRPWTDTFTVADSAGLSLGDPGPQRWSTTAGMRTLVESLAEGLDLEAAHLVASVDVVKASLVVDGQPAAAVVLAMPDPQAARLLSADLAEVLNVRGREWVPAFAVWAAWSARWWPEFDGVFVNDSPVISWVADSGRSHGDGALVLVAHTTAGFAGPRLADPQPGLGPVLAELPRVLGLDSMPEPEWARLHRWSFASALATHKEPFALLGGSSAAAHEPLIAVCGDAWGPKSRVEQAWRSGHGLAEVLIKQFAVR